MKRGKRLKRKTALRADPAKTREFIERGRGSLDADPDVTRAFEQRGRESGARSLRAAAVRAHRREQVERATEGPLRPDDWRRRVATDAGLRCRVTGARADDPFDEDFDAHHPLAKGVLRKLGLREHVWDPRNACFVTTRVHQRHTDAVERIPRECLPASVWEFCAELDELAGTRWATNMVAREHPATGSGGSEIRGAW